MSKNNNGFYKLKLKRENNNKKKKIKRTQNCKSPMYRQRLIATIKKYDSEKKKKNSKV